MKKELCVNDVECAPGFHYTGMDFSDVWNHIHNEIVPKMKEDCYTCGSHAEIEFQGLHDHISAGLGKVPFYPKNYANWVIEVNQVYDKCVNDGRCEILTKN